MQDRAVLRSVEQSRRITEEQDAEFLYACQRALLLALKEGGRLNEEQCRYAEEKLKAQRIAAARRPGAAWSEAISVVLSRAFVSAR